MSLWTPSGEHQVPRKSAASGPAAAPPGAPTAPPGGGPVGDDWRERLMAGELDVEELTPEQRAEVEQAVSEMAEAQRQLVTTPIEQMITQHIIGLRELAILHLQQPAPDFDAAGAAVDAIGGVIEAVGSRLGELEQPLRLDLQQLRIAFVQRKQQVEGPEAPES